MTIFGTVTLNTWARESNAGCEDARSRSQSSSKYTSSEQPAFLTTPERGTELDDHQLGPNLDGHADRDRVWSRRPHRSQAGFINDAGGTMARGDGAGRTVTRQL